MEKIIRVEAMTLNPGDIYEIVHKDAPVETTEQYLTRIGAKNNKCTIGKVSEFDIRLQACSEYCASKNKCKEQHTHNRR